MAEIETHGYCLACKWGVVDSHCDRRIELRRDWAEAVTCTRGDEGGLVRALIATEVCAREYPRLSRPARQAVRQVRLALRRRKMARGTSHTCACAPPSPCPTEIIDDLHGQDCPVHRAGLSGALGLMTPGCTCGIQAEVGFTVEGVKPMRPKPSTDIGSASQCYWLDAVGLPRAPMAHYASIAIYSWLETAGTANIQCLRELVGAYTRCIYERDDGTLSEWIEYMSRPGYTCSVAAQMRIGVDAFVRKAKDWPADPTFWAAPRIHPDSRTRLTALALDSGYLHVSGYWYCTDINGCLATRMVHDLFDWRDDLTTGEPTNILLQCVAAGESRETVRGRVDDCIAWLCAHALQSDYMTVGTAASVWYNFFSMAKTNQEDMLMEVAGHARTTSLEVAWEAGATSGAIKKCRKDLGESGLQTLIEWFDRGDWGDGTTAFAEQSDWFLLGWPESGSYFFTLVALDILVCRGDVVGKEIDRVWERVKAVQPSKSY